MRTTAEDVALQKERIINKSIEVFMKKGYAQTLLSDISSEIGITNGPLYYHYKNKLDLYSTSTEYYLKGQLEKIERIFHSKKGFYEKLEDDFLFFLEQGIIAAGKYYMEIVDLAQTSERLYEAFLSYSTRLRDIKHNAVLKAMEDGELRPDADPEEVLKVIYVLFEGLLYGYSPDSEKKDTVKILLNMLKLKYAP